MTQPFWIDTDMGSDDAVALMMALRAPDVDVVGISSVAGNVPVEQATINALYLTELCQRPIPVYRGAEQPLLRPFSSAEWFHGQDGLSGRGGQAQRPPEASHAIDGLIAAAHAHPGLVLVTLGPLTNIALAVARDPSIVPLISRCVVMGGAACTYGNVTPAAEYNIWVDPDAARMVFLSGMAVEMVGWEFCQGEYALDNDEIAALRALDTPLAHYAIDCNKQAIDSYFRQTGARGLSLPDPVAMAIALDPAIAVEATPHYVEVETHSDLTRGTTLVDKLNVAQDPRNAATWAQAIASGKNVTVTWQIDNARWKALLLDLLARE